MNASFKPSTLVLVAIQIVLGQFFSSCATSEDTPAPVVQLPVLTTEAISAITENAASSGGNITSDGGGNITSRGICWNTSPAPTTSNNKTSDGNGTGTFTSSMTGLSPKTTYFVRAYATNSAGTAYGQELSFETDERGIFKDLLAFWKLDENSGTIAKDAAGNWDLSMVNDPSWSNQGKIGSAADFGTTSTRHLERMGVTVSAKNTFTLSAWIYLTDDLAEAKNIMGINSGVTAINSGAAEVKLILTTDNRFTPMYHTANGGSNPMQRIGGITIEKDKWYHLVGVFNNGTITNYVNGVKDEGNGLQNPNSGNLQISNGRVTVGNARLYNGAYLPNRWFRGRIDEAGIWGRALSEAEVLLLYNNGNGLSHPF
jgi:hypothetical protein